MSQVVLSFDICIASSCQSLQFSETTGEYSENNATGYGPPNESTNDATAATLVVTTPALSSYTFNLFTQTPSWPTTDEDQLYYIYPIDLSQGNDKFLDGLYKFVYTVTTETTSYTTTIYKLFYCNIECCIEQMFALITDPSCDCQADAIAAASKAFTLLEALKRQAKCGKVAQFNTTMTILTKLCRNTNCETCG
jgi:hypothetical protein